MRRSRTAVVAVAALATAGAARGMVLDQGITFDDQYYHVISPGYSTAQTFTVEVAGLLSRTDLWVFRAVEGTQPVKLEIRQAAAGEFGAPTGPILASVLLNPADLPLDSFPLPAAGLPMSVDWSDAGLWVEPGQRYALIAVSNQPYASFDSYWWRTSSQGHNPYAGGAAWLSAYGDGGPWTAEESRQDRWMQTFVTVPEPGVAMAGAALAAGVARPRRLRR